MASGGKRGAGDRVLESRHVIGLFLLMLVFSGVFFSLGYVMGRNQYDGQVQAGDKGSRPDTLVSRNSEAQPKKLPNTSPAPGAVDTDSSTTNSGDSPWGLDNNDKAPNSRPHLDPIAKTPVSPAPAKPATSLAKSAPAAPLAHTASSKTSSNPPLIPSGAYLLQVAALAKQDDALALATSLQKKNFVAYVLTPQKDKLYRVQVGPFKDQKSADAARKGLENAGFKAFYVKH
jgi:cell division septation protein DedD